MVVFLYIEFLLLIASVLFLTYMAKAPRKYCIVPSKTHFRSAYGPCQCTLFERNAKIFFCSKLMKYTEGVFFTCLNAILV